MTANGSRIYAVDGRTGERKWTVDTNGSASLAVTGGLVFENGGCGQVSAYDAATGVRNWIHLIGQILLDLSVGKRPFEDCPKPPPEVLARFGNSADQPDTHRFEIPSDVATSLPPTFMLDPKVAEMRVYRA